MWRNVGEAVEQEEKLCDDVETVWEVTYFGDRMTGRIEDLMLGLSETIDLINSAHCHGHV